MHAAAAIDARMPCIDTSMSGIDATVSYGHTGMPPIMTSVA